MKIGIITFHYATNYGGVLQAFGLYNKLIELFPSSEVYIVDYDNRPFERARRSQGVIYQFISSITKMIVMTFSMKSRLFFRIFIKKYFRLININNIQELDYLVCGSDQIWNPKLTRGLVPHYFGHIKGFTGKTVIYAASDGGYLGDADPELLRKYLANITAISVRESTMLPLLNHYAKNVSVVSDPVYLFDVSFWKEFASKRKCQKYILIYCLSSDDNILRDAYKLASQKKLRIIQIKALYPIKDIFRSKHKVVQPSLPDFLSWFLYAEYIFTNSFHGLAFSIISNKQFYVYQLNNKLNNRIHCVLSEFNITNRYGSFFDVDALENIDYDIINDLHAKKRKTAIEFLKANLSDVL